MVVSSNIVPVVMLNPLSMEGGDPQETAVIMSEGNKLIRYKNRYIQSKTPGYTMCSMVEFPQCLGIQLYSLLPSGSITPPSDTTTLIVAG